MFVVWVYGFCVLNFRRDSEAVVSVIPSKSETSDEGPISCCFSIVFTSIASTLRPVLLNGYQLNIVRNGCLIWLMYLV